MSRFTGWLTSPLDDRGVYLAVGSRDWSYIGYRELARSAREVAAQLSRAGLAPGDVVCVTLPTQYESLAALFGVWAAGATLCPIPPPSVQSDDEYIQHLAAILEQAEPAATLTTPEFEPLVKEATRRAGLPAPLPIDPAADSEVADSEVADSPVAVTPRPGNGIALLQFTSGSTGTPRGVRVSWDNLEANFAVTARWTNRRADEGVASWLPLYHDMGLIGCLLSAIATQANIWLMQPMQFMRDPARWLECFAPGKASMAAAPPSAFSYMCRRVSADRLKGIDLSGWRCVIVGAETIDPADLDSFAALAAPAGFSHHTYLPAYGLAENTLAVTSAGLGRGVDMVLPDWSSLGFAEEVGILDQARFEQRPTQPGSGWLIGHGMPEPTDQIGLCILDESGGPLPEDHLGEIVVTGSSVALGYHHDHAGSSTRFVDGTLRTGDAGFLHDGQLFVLGRMGDSLQLHGRNVYVEDLDAKVAAAAGLGRDRICIVSVRDRAGVGVAAFVEASPGPWTEKVFQRLRAELGPGPTVTVVSGRRGLIRRTSSGKPRRRLMWQLLQRGQLIGTTIVEPNT